MVQIEKSALASVLPALFSVALTALLFLALPFAHQIVKPERQLDLRKTSLSDLPPPEPQEELLPPPTEPQDRDDNTPEPQLAESLQSSPLSADLELVLGAGGALAGLENVRALTTAQMAPEQFLAATDLDKQPEAVSQVAPVYPAELRRSKLEGLVTLIFVLNEEGRVEEPRIENSSHPAFEKPALDAIRKWRFRPGTKEGLPVRTYVRVPIRFRITS